MKFGQSINGGGVLHQKGVILVEKGTEKWLEVRGDPKENHCMYGDREWGTGRVCIHLLCNMCIYEHTFLLYIQTDTHYICIYRLRSMQFELSDTFCIPSEIMRHNINYSQTVFRDDYFWELNTLLSFSLFRWKTRGKSVGPLVQGIIENLI